MAENFTAECLVSDQMTLGVAEADQIAADCLFHYLIANFLFSQGCFLGRTAAAAAAAHYRVPPSESYLALPLLAAREKAWTLSACPPVTPAARQTAMDSPLLTLRTPSRTRCTIAPLSGVTRGVFNFYKDYLVKVKALKKTPLLK